MYREALEQAGYRKCKNTIEREVPQINTKTNMFPQTRLA